MNIYHGKCNIQRRINVFLKLGFYVFLQHLTLCFCTVSSVDLEQEWTVSKFETTFSSIVIITVGAVVHYVTFIIKGALETETEILIKIFLCIDNL
jgi:hypothetical protein